MKQAIILLSGGLDSVTALAIAQAAGYRCYAISFAYGQRANSEIDAAKAIAIKHNVVRHLVLPLALDDVGGSSLTDPSVAIPECEPQDNEIPNTYVPARNTIQLAITLGWAEVLGVYECFTGYNQIDYSNYPDCSREFTEAFENVAACATKAGREGQQFHIHSPLLAMNKAEIIKTGVELGVDYSMTVSCYQADIGGIACGKCSSCTQRADGFRAAGIADPTRYRK